MSNSPNSANPQTIYQAEPEVAEAFKKCKDRLHHVCTQHMNRQVRIQTAHGQAYDGVIVHVDSYYLYLRVQIDPSRAFAPYSYPGYGYPYGYGGSPYGYGFNPYASVILPLALFDLLTIALLI